MSPKSLEKVMLKVSQMTPEQIKKHHNDTIKALKMFNRCAPWIIILIVTIGVVAPLIANNVK